MKKPASFVDCMLFLIIILCSSSTLVSSQDSCSLKVDPRLSIPFDSTSFRCVRLWPAHNFLLRYGKDSADTINLVFSFPADIGAYAALGFSEDGGMVGSDAFVAWVDGGNIQTQAYRLRGKTPEQVIPYNDQPNTEPIDPTTQPTAYVYNASPVTAAPYLILAIGPKHSFPSAPNYLLSKHRDYIVLKINYNTGKVTLISSSMLRKSHGWLNMIGWSLLMMIGAIVARYCKQWDPHWFYLHTSIQAFAFLAGVVGIICGFALTQRIYITHHKNIGILILVLGCLQVIALVLRPRKESSLIRKYWNYYHHNVGRILLIFALVNSFYGLSLGREGSSWFAGYGATIGFLVIVAIILEIRMRILSKKEVKLGQRRNNNDLELVGA